MMMIDDPSIKDEKLQKLKVICEAAMQKWISSFGMNRQIPQNGHNWYNFATQTSAIGEAWEET